MSPISKMRGIWICWLIGSYYFVAGQSFVIKPPEESGCRVKNYGCYCPNYSGRQIPSKCSRLFDEELMISASGFPAPVTLTYPTLGADFNPIDMTAGSICKQDKYCEIKITPTNPNWGIIDWCLTTDASKLYHLQLLGPIHSPVCCDGDDTKYTMLCMRRDFNLQRFLPLPLLISVYIKLLPRALSLVLLDKASSVNNTVPAEFKDKKNTGGANVKLVEIKNLVLDLSKVKRWAEL